MRKEHESIFWTLDMAGRFFFGAGAKLTDTRPKIGYVIVNFEKKLFLIHLKFFHFKLNMNIEGQEFFLDSWLFGNKKAFFNKKRAQKRRKDNL